MDETSRTPSDEQSPEFWNNFALSVERKIQNSNQVNKIANPPVWDLIRSFLIFHPRYIAATVGSLAVLLLATIILWKAGDRTNRQQALNEEREESVTPVTQVDNRMAQYFRRSKTLLVGKIGRA